MSPKGQFMLSPDTQQPRRVSSPSGTLILDRQCRLHIRLTKIVAHEQQGHIQGPGSLLLRGHPAHTLLSQAAASFLEIMNAQAR